MIINQDTVERIYENAKAAKSIYEGLNLDNNFNKCFHLRPTGSGITIVSTLPYAPMRGKSVSKEKLEETLLLLNKDFRRICCEDTDKAFEVLEKLDYKKRTPPKSDLEENIQAEFIKGLLSEQSDYDGVTFITSELVLADESNRFDVVGFKNGILYIFELKKGRTFSALPQVSGYVKFVKENKDIFKRILSVYPNYSVNDFSDVKGIAVMEYAANVTPKLREDAVKNDVGFSAFKQRHRTVQKHP